MRASKRYPATIPKRYPYQTLFVLARPYLVKVPPRRSCFPFKNHLGQVHRSSQKFPLEWPGRTALEKTYFRRSYSQKDSTTTLTYHDQRTLLSHWDHQFSPNPSRTIGSTRKNNTQPLMFHKYLFGRVAELIRFAIFCHVGFSFQRFRKSIPHPFMCQFFCGLSVIVALVESSSSFTCFHKKSKQSLLISFYQSTIDHILAGNIDYM